MLTHVAACCHMLPPWKDLFKYSWSERSTPSGVISGVHFPTAEHRNRVRVCRVEETVPDMFRTIQNVWCLYALGSTLFPMQWLHAGIWPPTWAKHGKTSYLHSHQKSCFRIKSSVSTMPKLTLPTLPAVTCVALSSVHVRAYAVAGSCQFFLLIVPNLPQLWI